MYHIRPPREPPWGSYLGVDFGAQKKLTLCAENRRAPIQEIPMTRPPTTPLLSNLGGGESFSIFKK